MSSEGGGRGVRTGRRARRWSTRCRYLPTYTAYRRIISYKNFKKEMWTERLLLRTWVRTYAGVGLEVEVEGARERLGGWKTHLCTHKVSESLVCMEEWEREREREKEREVCGTRVEYHGEWVCEILAASCTRRRRFFCALQCDQSCHFG